MRNQNAHVLALLVSALRCARRPPEGRRAARALTARRTRDDFDSSSQVRELVPGPEASVLPAGVQADAGRNRLSRRKALWRREEQQKEKGREQE
jgi:hypothetical protein